MTKNFALAASIAMLMTISGQALAATAAPNARYGSEATSPSAWQTVYAGNAFNGTAATETAPRMLSIITAGRSRMIDA